jgi:hypothetical protein
MADEGLTPEQIMFKKKYGRLPPKKKAMKGPLGRVGGGVSWNRCHNKTVN